MDLTAQGAISGAPNFRQPHPSIIGVGQPSVHGFVLLRVGRRCLGVTDLPVVTRTRILTTPFLCVLFYLGSEYEQFSI